MKKKLKDLDIEWGRVGLVAISIVGMIGELFYSIKDRREERKQQAHNDEVISQAVTKYLDDYMNSDDDDEESEENED